MLNPITQVVYALQEAWNLVVDPIMKLVLGTEVQLPRGRAAHLPIQRSLLLLLLPLLQRLCIGSYGGKGKVSEPHLGAVLAALHAALDAGDKQSGGTVVMGKLPASAATSSSPSTAALPPPPGLVAEPWSPAEAACWSDLLVAMFSALMPAGNGELGHRGAAAAAATVAGEPPPEGIPGEADGRPSKPIVPFVNLAMRLMRSLAAAPPTPSPCPSDKGVARTSSGNRDGSESSLPMEEPGASAFMQCSPQQPRLQQRQGRDGVTAAWTHFVHAACRINALAAQYISSSSSSSSLPSSGSVLDTMTLALSMLQLLLGKASPECLHAVPLSCSDAHAAASAAGGGTIEGPLPSLSLWGELARSWLGMLGKCGALAGNTEWLEGLSSLVQGAGERGTAGRWREGDGKAGVGKGGSFCFSP